MKQFYSYHIIKGLSNSIILVCDKTKKCAIIDPSNYDNIIKKIDELRLNVSMILLTHGHYDHIFYADKLRNLYSIKIYCHNLEEEYLLDINKNYSKNFIGKNITLTPDFLFNNKNLDIKLGELNIKIIETPGHTKGSVSYFIEDDERPIVFSGDTLFNSTIGRTDLYGGNFSEIINSIEEKLLILPKKTLVIPGHGNPTFIEHELKTINNIKANNKISNF